MPHFFINQSNISNKTITISDADNYRHIAIVLRTKIGESLKLIDQNQVQYETVVKNISKTEIQCEIMNSYISHRDLDINLYLAQSILRSDAQLTIMEKATELGIRGVYPLITDNCSVNKDVADKKVEKWQKVMYEASKQCERAIIPTCFPISNLEEVLKNKFNRIMVFGEHSAELSLKEYITANNIKKDENICVIIGPEGGFSEREFKLFKKNNLPIVTLGELILKAETAVIVALGDIIYEYQG